MSTIGFLLSPLREIPAELDDRWLGTVQSWLHIAHFAWSGLWQQLPEQERRGAPRMAPGRGLSSNAMSADRKKDPVLIASAQPWAENALRTWINTEPKPPVPVLDVTVAHEALSLDSRISLPELVGYSGGFTQIPAKKLKRGGMYAFLKNAGDRNANSFNIEDGTQSALFLEVARGHGGDYLAVWTFGHSLNVLVARSTAPGTRPTLHGPYSVRVRVAAGACRPGGFVEALESALTGSNLRPDFSVLRAELGKPELSVETCFEALGLPGARDFASPDAAARWEEMDRAGIALLNGEPVEKSHVKNINALLEPLGDSVSLPAKGKTGKGVLARAVANVIVNLRDALGIPEANPWPLRFRAANFYWDITDGEAGSRLTVGTDKAGLGTAASVPRLLAHFPKSLMRDPIFFSMLALECEAANGHAFVEGLAKLAEQTREAGLVLVVVSADQRAALRNALAISSEETGSVAGAWCGEALISGTTIAKGYPAEAARKFMAKSKATGAIAELSASREANIEWYKAGLQVKTSKEAGLNPVDHAALNAASKEFLPREAFVALGAGDLLAPGSWTEGSYSGASPDGVEDHRAQKRRHAQKILSGEVTPTTIASAGELRTILGQWLRYRGPLSETDGGIVSLRVTLPVDDAIWVRDFRNDLAGGSMISRYGEAWTAGREVRGYSCSTVDVALLVQLLGDAPAGTTVTIGKGNDLIGAWTI